MILTGWKQIADYLGYGVHMVQRWERQKLPVLRVSQGRRSPVVADSEELKSWILRNRRGANPPPPILRNIHRAQELQLRINAEEVRFLRTDVELGLKFSEIALQTTDRNKTNRNRANGQKAYEAVLHLLPKVSLTAEENGDIRVKLTQLKSNLEQLRHKT